MTTPNATDRALAHLDPSNRPRRIVLGSAPGRVNLIGEHVDHEDGVVLPVAIDRRATVAVATSLDGATTISAPDIDASERIAGPPPDAPLDGVEFANHLLGVLKAAGGSGAPLDLSIFSDVPIGAGVSSSAAIEVACGAAFSVFRGDELPDPKTLAAWARSSEHEFVGTPCGWMDMLASAAGRKDHALRIDCRDLSIEPIPLPPADQFALLLFDSGVRHRLSDGGYADRLGACERVRSALGKSMRDATLEDLERAEMDPTDRMRGRHVVTEMARVDAAVADLRRGDLDAFGQRLFDGHESLRSLFEVSVPELDLIVDTARDLVGKGVYGARMTGGGFGGTALVLVAPPRIDDVRTSISSAFEKAFGRTPATWMAHTDDGVRIDHHDLTSEPRP